MYFLLGHSDRETPERPAVALLKRQTQTPWFVHCLTYCVSRVSHTHDQWQDYGSAPYNGSTLPLVPVALCTPDIFAAPSYPCVRILWVSIPNSVRVIMKFSASATPFVLSAKKLVL